METMTPTNQLPSTGKRPLMTRIRDRLRDARDEYREHIEAGHTRAAAQRPRQKQANRNHQQQHDSEPTEPHDAARNVPAALTAQNLELHQTRHAEPGDERKAKEPHKHRHHSHHRKDHPHQEPAHRARHKHPNPDHGKHPHGKHRTSHSQEGTDTAHLVERLVRRLEKGVEDESTQVECLQDVAQRLFRIADEKGKRVSNTKPPTDDAAEGTGEASRNTGPIHDSVENEADELIEQAKQLEEGAARRGDRGDPAGSAGGAVDMAGGLLEAAGEGRRSRGECARRAEAGVVDVRPSRREGRGEIGGGGSPMGRDRERGRGRGGSVCSLGREEGG
ncbi:hypothetical protein MMC32_004261 [Xylographa parallela]|nr:hypothetical protein [Xylographa parallela]